jgi:hypothetical protein
VKELLSWSKRRKEFEGVGEEGDEETRENGNRMQEVKRVRVFIFVLFARYC